MVLALSIVPLTWNGVTRADVSVATGVSQQSRAGAALDHLVRDLKARDNLVWVPHLIPDTDSASSSLLAAYIYGGVATVPGPLNPESRFAIEQCDAEAPAVVEDYSQNEVVALVDFNQVTQLPPTVDPASIVAIIDHHALGGSPINIPQVISIDIKPWGSVAAMLADHAEMLSVELPKPLACMALAGILSDTVNLTLPTTTDYDRDYVKRLAVGAGIEDTDDFAEQMLLAKSDLSDFSGKEIVLLDYKNFDYGGKEVGIGVAETLTADQLIDRKDELKAAMQEHKAESGLDHLVFAIVDTRNHKSYLLWGDEVDKGVLTAAFGDEIVDDMVVADGVTSRKRQIGPAVQKTVEALSRN